MFAADTDRNDHYERMYKIQRSLYKQSGEFKNFKNVTKLVFLRENIFLALREMKNLYGFDPEGLNKLNYEELVKLDVEDTFKSITKYSDSFTRYKVTGKLISRSNKTKQRITIPDFKYRVLEQMIYNILEPISEGRFLNVNYGYRREKSEKDAINSFIRKSVESPWIIKINLSNTLNDLKHIDLIKSIKKIGVLDSKFLKLIDYVIKSHTNGEDHGLPVNSVITPLLFNIFINQLDDMIYYSYEDPRKILGRHIDDRGEKCFSIRHTINRRDERWMGVRTGYIQRKKIVTTKGVKRSVSKYQLRKINLCRGLAVRYYDYMIISCKSADDAKRFSHKLDNYMNKVGISYTKEPIFNARRERVNFLGYSIKLFKGGKYTIKVDKSSWTNLRREVIRYSHLLVEEKIDVHSYNTFVRRVSSYFDFITNYYSSMHYLDTLQFLVLRRHHGINGWFRGTMELKENHTYYGVRSRYLTKLLFGKHEDGVTRWILPFTNKEHSRDDLKYKSPNTERIMYRYDNDYDDKSLIQTKKTSWFKYENTCRRDDIYMSVLYRALYEHQKGIDLITGKNLYGRDTHVHHIIPRSKGGTSEFKNLCLLDLSTHKLIHTESTIKEDEFLSKFPNGNYSTYLQYKSI